MLEQAKNHRVRKVKPSRDDAPKPVKLQVFEKETVDDFGLYHEPDHRRSSPLLDFLASIQGGKTRPR
jgi:hypothetical protein